MPAPGSGTHAAAVTDDTANEPATDVSSPERPDRTPGQPRDTTTPYAGLLSLGAGAIHAAAAGIHAEHPQLARIFVVLAALQIGTGLFALLRPSRLSASAVFGVNLAAVGGWLATRLWGIGWIDGLEASEAPQFADAACAVLGVGSVVVAALAGRRTRRPVGLAVPGVLVAALAVPAMLMSVTHVHADDHGSHTDAGSEHVDDHDVDAVAAASAADVAHDDHDSADHDDGHAADVGAADHDAVHDDAGRHDEADHSADHDVTQPVAAASTPWPRPWDPAIGLDLTGVEGVSAEQQARAEALVEASLRELPSTPIPPTRSLTAMRRSTTPVRAASITSAAISSRTT